MTLRGLFLLFLFWHLRDFASAQSDSTGTARAVRQHHISLEAALPLAARASGGSVPGEKFLPGLWIDVPERAGDGSDSRPHPLPRPASGSNSRSAGRSKVRNHVQNSVAVLAGAQFPLSRSFRLSALAGPAFGSYTEPVNVRAEAHIWGIGGWSTSGRKR